jgi:hypothetical protein
MNNYCYTCGTKLRTVTIERITFNTNTGKPNTFSYEECPKAKKLGWWKSLWHIVFNPYTEPYSN